MLDHNENICIYYETQHTFVIVWQLDLHLPMQSVPITTQVVSSNNSTHVEVYSIQHYVIKFDSDLREVGGFLRVLRLPPLIKLTLKLTQIPFCESFDTTQNVGIFRQDVYLDTKLCVLLKTAGSRQDNGNICSDFT